VVKEKCRNYKGMWINLEAPRGPDEEASYVGQMTDG